MKKQMIAFLISAILLLFCNSSFAIQGDITGDSKVDFNDLVLIAQYWTQTFAAGENNSADITGDSKVNFDDYAVLAKNWMVCEYTGPVGWWKFNDAAGTIAADAGPYNNYATLVGNPQWKNDPNQGWCLELDGYGDSISVTNESAFDMSNQITISAWIKTIAGTDDALFAVTKSDAYMLYKDVAMNGATFYCKGLGRPVLGKKTINDGNWHHIVGVYDGKAKYLYVDGQLDGTVSYIGTLKTNDFNVSIGSCEPIADNQCKGRIDDVRIFNRALSLEEINLLPDEKLKQAAAPYPADNAPWASHDARLRWIVANDIDSQYLFVGTDYQQVTDADISSPEFKGSFAPDVNSYFQGPQAYDANITYYWRIDQIFDSGTVKGKTWSFTAGDSYIFDFPAGSLAEVEKVAAYCLQGLCNKVGAKVLM
ncbi:MAG TPA: dockerin type I domain-containing protein, partial [Sedimentisphaerales bacterium]|nr:dockerin type I domain-containing protein [Sedimentisphaerales bacterium]